MDKILLLLQIELGWPRFSFTIWPCHPSWLRFLVKFFTSCSYPISWRPREPWIEVQWWNVCRHLVSKCDIAIHTRTFRDTDNIFENDGQRSNFKICYIGAEIENNRGMETHMETYFENPIALLNFSHSLMRPWLIWFCSVEGRTNHSSADVPRITQPQPFSSISTRRSLGAVTDSYLPYGA